MMGERNDGVENSSNMPFDWASETSDIEDLKLGVHGDDIFADEEEEDVDEDADVIAEQQQQDVKTTVCGKRTSDQISVTKTRTVTTRRFKKKRSGLPKRPLSAYNIFFQRERLQLQKDQNLSFEEFGKIIGKRWKELLPEARKLFDDLARDDGYRYRSEMEAYKARKNKRKLDSAEATEGKNNAATDDVAPAPWGFPRAPPNFFSGARGYCQFNGPIEARLPTQQQSNQLGRPYYGHPPPPPSAPAAPPGFWNQQAPLFNGGYPGPNSYRDPTTNSGPPAPQHSSTTGGFPVPPGMEVYLPGADGCERKYAVHYTMYSMTREAAERLMTSLAPMYQAKQPSRQTNQAASNDQPEVGRRSPSATSRQQHYHNQNTVDHDPVPLSHHY